MNSFVIDCIGLFLCLAGFVVGLGSVTVIDLHGFFARRSPYRTDATIRTHKVTKPLIWIGLFLACAGWLLYFRVGNPFGLYHLLVLIALVINGCFLSFVISPYLLEQEKRGESRKLLPSSLQTKIVVSFLISFFGWWGSLALIVWQIVARS